MQSFFEKTSEKRPLYNFPDIEIFFPAEQNLTPVLFTGISIILFYFVI